MPTVICVAPNGARRTKDDHAHIPFTASELAADAKSCMAAGATAIHVHIRDGQGRHTLDPTLYREAIEFIRKATDGNMVIQITTEACGIFKPEEQMATVREVRPEAASVAIREIVPDDSSVPVAAEFFAWARARGIGLQYVVYDQSDLQHAIRLQKSGVIPNEQPHMLLVLGRYSVGQPSKPADLLSFLELMPMDWPWTVCAFGMSEADCMQAAVAKGGNCRVGFENNIQLPNGDRAANNATLVSRLRHEILRSSREIGSIRDARALYLG